MISKAAVIRQTVLISGVICVLPLILFPATLGLSQFTMHPLLAVVEGLLYFALYIALLSKLSVRQKLVAGGVTVLFRFALGVVLGLLLSIMHGLPLLKAISIGMWSYPPAIFLHICFTPFLLRPLYNRVWERGIRFSIDGGRQPAPERPTTGFSFSNTPAAEPPPTRSRTEAGDLSFDAATAWIGDYSGVRCAALVDEDGLVVSRWERQKYSQDAEYWAAVAVEMTRYHRGWPAGEPVDLRRLEVETGSGRLTIKQAGPFWVVVLTEVDAGDLVSVRITQAIEMIEKHRNDRYRAVRSAGLEVSHV